MRLHAFGDRHTRSGVHGAHVSTTRLCQPAHGLAGDSQAYDTNGLPEEVHIYLSFSVDRATSASRMLMIQNRTMIFGSDHPRFSK